MPEDLRPSESLPERSVQTSFLPADLPGPQHTNRALDAARPHASTSLHAGRSRVAAVRCRLLRLSSGLGSSVQLCPARRLRAQRPDSE
eukprot:364901-Chlamydomonas_euryale.AAC.8